MDFKIFASRRQRLINQLSSSSIVILFSAPEQVFSADVNYPYHQNSYFYYLTGCLEPKACLVIVKEDNSSSSLLFIEENTRVKELWLGAKISVSQAKYYYEVDESYDKNSLNNSLLKLLPQYEEIYYLSEQLDYSSILATSIESINFSTNYSSDRLYDLRLVLDPMRMLKDTTEINNLTKAVDISMVAHRHVMRLCQAGQIEYQLAASFIYSCMHSGATHQAYSPIVATGSNACTLHYTSLGSQLQDGDLLLIDAGCEYKHYTADITRTLPVNGVFNWEQSVLYDLVLDAQNAALAAINPDASLHSLHMAAVKILAQGLLDCGLLQGDLHSVIESQSYTEFYPHSTGHYLGLDVHDVGGVKDYKHQKLNAGMLLTVEPGLYIHPNSKVDPKWHGIGIRIEDDILITPDGYKVLSGDLVKSRSGIEKEMRVSE